MYSLASWEYQIMNGLSAVNAAATTPARRETSSRPHRYAIGITAVPTSADSDRSPTSPVPNTRAHSHPSTKYSGGLVSWTTIELTIDPNDRCSS